MAEWLQWVTIALGLSGVTLFLSILDLYPKVEAFWPIFRTPSYYFLFAITLLFNLAAAYLLRTYVFKSAGIVETIFLAAIAAFSIIQSFTLKFADYKIINLSDAVESLKGTVLEDITKRKTALKGRMIRQVGQELAERFKDNEEKLISEFTSLGVALTGASPEEIAEEIRKLKDLCNERNLDFIRLLALNVAQLDLDAAKDLIRRGLDR